MTDAPYADAEIAALYDLSWFDYDDDVNMYAQFAMRGDGRALELMAGSGRVALRLAREGVRVTCLDSAPAMLARLRDRLDDATRDRVRILEADVRDFDLGEAYDFIFCALISFEHLLTDGDALAALRCAGRHLAPGGVFVLELRTLASVDWSGETVPLRIEWTRADPETSDTVMKMSSVSASQSTQTTTTTLIHDRTPADGGTVRRRSFDATLRVWGRFEFEALLERAGLRLAQVYGDYDLSPLADGSDRMIVVAEPAS